MHLIAPLILSPSFSPSPSLSALSPPSSFSPPPFPSLSLTLIASESHPASILASSSLNCDIFFNAAYLQREREKEKEKEETKRRKE